MPLFGVAGSLIEGFGELFSGLFDAARARRQAHDVRSRAKADIYDAARDFRARQGAAETAIGKSGLQVEGSALDHLLDESGGMVDELLHTDAPSAMSENRTGPSLTITGSIDP